MIQNRTDFMEKYRLLFEQTIDRRWLVIGLICVLAFSLRAIRPFVVDRIAKDGVLYVSVANDISQGNLNIAFRKNRRMPPLYVFMMAGLHKLGFNLETAGKLISIIAGVLLIIPVYLITEMIFKSRVAAMGAFLVAVNPDMIKISARVMRDSLFLAILFTAVYFVIKAMKTERWNLHFWSISGLLVSIGVAVRTESIEIIPITIIWMIVELISLKRDKKPILPTAKRWSVGLLMLVSIYLIAAIPFIKTLEGTSSTWSIVDERIPGYFRTFLRLPEKDAIEVEDTL
jgi:4-amino-4-deoxy-L-arabinose transferase-like glycosyltransferase